jgi:hypothetical protein
VKTLPLNKYILVLALLAGLGLPLAAQVPVTSADIQRLQDSVFEASRDVSQLRSRDATLASQLQSELDEARDEAIYLKVKLRKQEAIARGEYADLRDRIDGIRNRAAGETFTRSTPLAPASPAPSRSPSTSDERGARASGSSRDLVAVGTEFDVRLQSSLNSGTSQVEDRFDATTLVDLKDGDRVLVPAGSVMRGVVSSVNKAGRVERRGSMTIAFDRFTIQGRSYPIRATVTKEIESSGIRGEAGKIGTGAGVGAVIGAILGGTKGAVLGGVIGAGGTIAATEGKDVELPSGTVLRVRLDSGLDLRSS